MEEKKLRNYEGIGKSKDKSEKGNRKFSPKIPKQFNPLEKTGLFTKKNFKEKKGLLKRREKTKLHTTKRGGRTTGIRGPHNWEQTKR